MTPTAGEPGPQQTHLSDMPGAEAALLDLCRPFAPPDFRPACTVVQPDQIPYPQDHLLVHHRHMTVVLERHHRAPVDVHVLAEHLDGDIYTRMIRLTPQGQPDKVVEWGIVKLDFRFIAPIVREEILRKRTPLGAILVRHDVLRRIKPRWFLRLPADGPTMALFGGPPPPDDAYARIGMIYCNEEPAIEVLEIVLNAGDGLATSES